MKHYNLDCKKRHLVGNTVRKLRNRGQVPAVVYGKEMESVNIQLDLNTFIKLFRNAGRTSVIDVNIDEKEKYPVLVHDIDYDPVSDQIRHIDFMFVDLKKKTHAEVPIVFVGEPDKSSGGVLNQQLSIIEVEALPEKIPHHFEIDLSALKEIGDLITVKDITNIEDVEIVNEADQIIATLAEPQKEEVETVVTTEEIAENSDSLKSDNQVNNKENKSE